MSYREVIRELIHSLRVTPEQRNETDALLLRVQLEGAKSKNIFYAKQLLRRLQTKLAARQIPEPELSSYMVDAIEQILDYDVPANSALNLNKRQGGDYIKEFRRTSEYVHTIVFFAVEKFKRNNRLQESFELTAKDLHQRHPTLCLSVDTCETYYKEVKAHPHQYRAVARYLNKHQSD